ncbi:hypothetical protein FRB96_000287 [Tulasnella sp. 330]|nr:hypothetical protein FRB96_000287 [Tulasnella sp. 330]KAG8882264.1 hypothetical protein FRB97_008467 [Tulasnella sp. 331]
MQTTNTENLFRTESAIKDEEARKRKADRMKDIGEPIAVDSKIIKAVIQGDEAWTAESGHIARRVDLKTRKTLQIYKGHKGPVTCLALYNLVSPDGSTELLLITGSWDKVWPPKLGGHMVTDIARLNSDHQNMEYIETQKPLHQLTSLSGHTRPVEALAYSDDVPNTLLTGDSMGVIKVWSLENRWASSPESLPTVKARLLEHSTPHATGINDLILTSGYLWTASTDQTATLRPFRSQSSIAPASSSNISHHIFEHKEPARCVLAVAHKLRCMPYVLIATGDVIRLYDVEDLLKYEDDEDDTEDAATKLRRGVPRMLCEIDVHSQPVTSLGIWKKETPEGATPWIVSGSLDGTLRHWDLAELAAGKVPMATPSQSDEGTGQPAEGEKLSALTEEEERELAELMSEE